MKFIVSVTLVLALSEKSQATEYYNVTAGGVCNNEYDVIRTIDECTKALSELGYKFKTRYWEGSTPNIPSGCSLRTRNQKLHLNDKPGVGRGRKDQIPICKNYASCNDEIQNQDEDGIDCGGPCDACQTCEDEIQNQGEAGIDCGGPCSACPSCNDEIQNQDEDEVDCGGPCEACQTCEDGIQNQGEADIDCGGPCSACPSCNDKIQNQGEDEVDCGGPCDDCQTAEDCKCNNQGKKWSQWGGYHWCYIEKTPCTLLTGREKSSGDWLMCAYKGVTYVAC